MVQESASNPGAATTINLAGAATGRRSFVAAFGGGALVDYVIEDGSSWEYGIGTVTAGSPNTLTRTTVVENSAGTTARLNFTGTVRVYCALSMTRIGWMQVEAPRTVAAVAQSDFALPLSFRRFRLLWQGITPDTGGRQLALRFSTDGGSTYIAGTSYVTGGSVASGAAWGTPASGGFNGAGCVYLSNGLSSGSNGSGQGTTEVVPGSASLAATVTNQAFHFDGTNWQSVTGGGACSTGARATHLRVYTASGVQAGTAAGSFSGVLILEGYR
jgi:hypothetical protein